MIPEPFRQALREAHPEDYFLRCLIADYLESTGDPLAAEALRWSIEKERIPLESVLSPGGFGWNSEEDRYDGGVLPNRLFLAATYRDRDWGERLCGAFDVLIRRWKATSADDHEAFWRWQPPSEPTPRENLAADAS